MPTAVEKVQSSLKGQAFVGGATPNKQDVELFHELLGKDNQFLHRWVRHMASWGADERGQWKSQKGQKAAVVSCVDGKTNGAGAAAAAAKHKDPAKPAAAAAPAKKDKPKSEVTVEIKTKAGADAKQLETYIRQIKVEGIDYGVFVATATGLRWKCIVEDHKISKQDLTDMTEGFQALVESATFASWVPWKEPGDDDEM
eukprot:TRINITY_DN7510_c0_g2_i1.p2 TRINITY_DN7510_c0_g2~~TRINITY_DN7510_c0_g2_i1.p2  ORF type:complete len:199 (+),score=83.79 TRINITY_DN7510_c0_g2_i1:83-679(+)